MIEKRTMWMVDYDHELDQVGENTSSMQLKR